MLKNIFLLILFLNIIYADTTKNEENNKTYKYKYDYLDRFRLQLSSKLKYVSAKTDIYLSNKEYKDNKNKTKQELNGFFLNSDYYDNYNDSYMIYTFGYSYGAFEKLTNIHNIKVKIDLPHTKKRLKLIIDGEYDEDVKSITNTDNTELALEYIFPFMDSTFRGGFRGVTNPFIRLRMGMENNFKLLIFEPIQYFEYSNKYKFKETTKLYFDKKINDRRLLEILIQRSTQTNKTGTEWFGGLFYSVKYAQNRGLVYELSSLAETKPEDNKNKIISHTIKATWRQNIYKKYMFINISPFMQYHRKYNYYREPFLMVTFDIKF
jgi:hypothetical protein